MNGKILDSGMEEIGGISGCLESKVHECSNEETGLSNVAAFSQESLEQDILNRVDTAIKAQKDVERLEVFEQKTQDLLKKIEKLEKVRNPSSDQSKNREAAEKLLSKILSEGPNGVELLDDKRPKDFLTDVYSVGKDSTSNRLVSSGEATPFDLLGLPHNNSVRSIHGFETLKTGRSRVEERKADREFKRPKLLRKKEERKKEHPKKDKKHTGSEDEYRPSSGSEEEVSDFSEEEEFSEDRKKRKSCETFKSCSKKSKTQVASPFALGKDSKDDGNDKFFERRIIAHSTETLKREAEDDIDEDVVIEGGLKVPSKIWSELYKYQRTGVRWLWELHCQSVGGIMGDEMGLGKTVQVISFLAALTHSKLPASGFNLNGLGPVLIVCPATMMQQWVMEFHRWWPEFRVAIFHSTGSYKGKKSRLVSKLMSASRDHKRPVVLVTSYSTMNLDKDILLNPQYTWHYIILDEGHKIKNPDGQVTLSVKRFPTPHRLILTGSPMQNSLKELWSLFDFVYPGKLGTLPVFMEEFSVPITQGGYANASQVQVQTAYQCACLLRDAISPYLLRRMKKDVNMSLQLPTKNEQVLFCMITEEQRRLYKDYLNSRECDKILSGGIDAFVGLILLRKLCNHPDLVTGGPNRLGDLEEWTDESLSYGHWSRSGKMAVVRSLLKIWKRQDHKVLLFSQSRQMLRILEIFVKKEGYSYLRMDGSSSIGSRQGLVERFNNDPQLFVFLLTTRVGGLGVNLTGADRVLIYDPDWNPSTDTQARERAWRIGQDRPVTIYRLLTSGTIEEKIYHRQIFKQFLTNRILSDPRQRRFFKTNDLHELFTLTDDRDFSKSQKTETAALFAGTGSEIKLGEKRKKRTGGGNSENFFDKLAEEKRKKIEKRETETEEKDEEDIDFVPEPKKETELTDKRVRELKKLAKMLSKQLSDKKGLGNGKRKGHRRKKAVLFDGTERVPYLAKQETLNEKETSDDRNSEKTSKDQDDYVLGKLFKKSGVHTALRHDNIMASSHPDFALVEGEAEQVAKKAAKALSQSRRICRRSGDISKPTWTGKFGVAGKSKPRFGNGKVLSISTDPVGPNECVELFGGRRLVPSVDPKKKVVPPSVKDELFSFTLIKKSCSEPANIEKRNQQNYSTGMDPDTSKTDGVVSSTDLLATIEARKLQQMTSFDLGSDESSDEEELRREGFVVKPNNDMLTSSCVTLTRHDILAEDIRAYIASRDGIVTTEDVLRKFLNDVPNEDSSIFKAILKRLCVFYRNFETKEGTWRLKDQFT